MAKILCPYHEDTVPSMEVYEEYSHCYVCSAHIKNSELGVEDVKQTKKPKENIKESIQRIQNLPVKWLRGVRLPFDDTGAYIVWQSRDYYKKRNFKGEPRYTAPTGARQPLFIYPGTKKHLVVIEGELNAMTVNQYCPGSYTICSPGGATGFSKFIDKYLEYDKITLVLDHDPAGIVYGAEMKELLLKSHKYVKLITVDIDYNDLFIQGGAEAVFNKFREDIK